VTSVRALVFTFDSVRVAGLCFVVPRGGEKPVEDSADGMFAPGTEDNDSAGFVPGQCSQQVRFAILM
jgi:hypothetical protein